MPADVSPRPKRFRGAVTWESHTLGGKRYRGWALAGWIVLLAIGATFSAVGAVELQREIALSANGVPALGRVVDVAIPKWTLGGAPVDLELKTSEGSPLRTRVGHPWFNGDLPKDTTLRLICVDLSTQGATCQVDTFIDRWLEPMVLLVIGLPALLIGWIGLSDGDASYK